MVFNSTRYYTVISSYKWLHEAQGKTLAVPGMYLGYTSCTWNDHKSDILKWKNKVHNERPQSYSFNSWWLYHPLPQESTELVIHFFMWSPGIVSCFDFLRIFFFTFAFSLLNLLQFNSVTQSCPTLCDPMDCSTPGFPVHHQLPEFTQTHVYRVGDAIQPPHPLSSPSPPTCNLSQHLGLFKWVSYSHQVAKVLEFQLQHQSFQWTPRTDLL